MKRMVVTGEKAELDALAKSLSELAKEYGLSKDSVSITEVAPEALQEIDAPLGAVEWAGLAIAVVSGMVSNAFYDAAKAAILRWVEKRRNRARVEES